jgi:hypothetical protein
MHAVFVLQNHYIEHVISMVTTSKISITHKPLYIQGKLDIVNKVDTALNFLCKKKLVKNLAFLCHFQVWLHEIKIQYSKKQSVNEQLSWQKMKTAKYGTINQYLWDVVLCSRMSDSH